MATRRAGLAAAAPLVRGRVSARTEAMYRQGQAASKATSAKKTGIVGAPRKASSATPKPPPPPPPAAAAAAAPAAPTPTSAAEAVPPVTKRNNLLIGAVLVGCVGASYFVTINKMQDQDFLGEVEKEAEEQAQVNLHKSGLKVSAKVVPEQPTFSRSPAADEIVSKAEAAVASAKSAVAEAAEEVKEEASEAVAAVKEEAVELADVVKSAATGEEDGAAKKKKKGWRKYWLFGPRVGGD